MAKVTIQKIGERVHFSFNGSDRYQYNGTSDWPLNSLSMVIDESNQVTFKNHAGDIVFSIALSDLEKTKAEMEQLYEDAFVGDTGGGGGEVTPEEVEEMIDEALTPIESAIDDIDSALSGKADTSDVYTKTEIDEALSGKADASDVEAVSNGLTAHTSDSAIHVTSQDKSNWNAKADADDVEEQFEVAAIAITELKEKVDEKADASNVYTKSEVNAVLATKATNADLQALSATTTAHTANTNIHVTSSDKTNWDAKANASDLQALSSTTTAHTANTNIHVTSSDKTAWDAKADNSRLGGLSFVRLTQAQYDALVTKDANTVYIILD